MSYTYMGFAVGKKFEKKLCHMVPSQYDIKELKNDDYFLTVKKGDLIPSYYFDTFEEAYKFLLDNLPKYKTLRLYSDCADFGGGITFRKSYLYKFRG